MKNMKAAALLAVLLLAGTAAAQIPTFQQFYGEIRDDSGNKITDKTVNITAYIKGELRGSGSSSSGMYGYSPLFFVENGENGDTIGFHLDGQLSTTYAFEEDAATELNLTLSQQAQLICGNSQTDPGEECDLTSINETCESLGYAGGTIYCNPDCTLNTSACTPAVPVSPPSPPGPGGGGGNGGGGGSSNTLQISVAGNCVGKPVKVSILNYLGNPAPDATVSITKGMRTIAEKTTGFDGNVSFTLNDPGEYTVGATKNNYLFASKTTTITDCSKEPLVPAETCVESECDDNNPCTMDQCDANKTKCIHPKAAKGTPCGKDLECINGKCTGTEAQQQPAAGGQPGAQPQTAQQATGIISREKAAVVLIACLAIAGIIRLQIYLVRKRRPLKLPIKEI